MKLNRFKGKVLFIFIYKIGPQEEEWNADALYECGSISIPFIS